MLLIFVHTRKREAELDSRTLKFVLGAMESAESQSSFNVQIYVTRFFLITTMTIERSANKLSSNA